MKQLTRTVASTLLAILFLQACKSNQSVVKSIPSDSKQQIYRDISVLSHDSLGGRGTGQPGELKAASYIVSRFTELGLSPKGADGWIQTFSFKPQPAAQIHMVNDSAKLGMALVKEITGRNVIAYKDFGAINTIIIGAHFDHLGMGEENSLWTGDAAIHNGADDNASGVAALLEIAHEITNNPSKYKGNNYLFIAFSGEERGLWGSNYFCKNPTIDLTKVTYMLNMDMVGRLNSEKRMAINGTGTSPTWNEVLQGLATEVSIITSESGVGPSDHTSFYNMDIPVLHFFTGQHEDYHKPSDDVEKINLDGELLVVNYIERLISTLNTKEKLAFTRTKDESTTKASSFKVTLGVIPDYLYDGEGMRLDGTKEGRPAEKAGLIKGDIVLKIGDYNVNDMQTYMDALSKFDKGQTTPVLIKRNGEEMTFMVFWE
jgi:Zn-dependent M28 family amino/carboxypeptidase